MSSSAIKVAKYDLTGILFHSKPSKFCIAIASSFFRFLVYSLPFLIYLPAHSSVRYYLSETSVLYYGPTRTWGATALYRLINLDLFVFIPVEPDFICQYCIFLPNCFC